MTFRVPCSRCDELIFAAIPVLDVTGVTTLYEHAIAVKPRVAVEPTPQADALGSVLRFFDVVPVAQ